MDLRERKFAIIKIFTKTLLISVICRLVILIVISYLELNAYQADEVLDAAVELNVATFRCRSDHQPC